MNDIVVSGEVIGKKYGKVLDVDSSNGGDIEAGSLSVLYVDNIYHTWYGGSSFIDEIHYATSTDGKNWKRHGVVLNIGDSDDSDSFQISSPTVIYDGSTFKMWYSGFDGGHWRVHYATSLDGKQWTKHGVILDVGVLKNVYDYISDCASLYSISVIYDGSKYQMWYSGSDGTHSRIHYATSTDGKNWKKHGIVLNLGVGGITDCKDIDTPSVIYDGKIFHMLYTGIDGEIFEDDDTRIKWRIHYATSKNGKNWKKHGVVISISSVNDSDYRGMYSPSIIKHNDVYKIWYSGWDGITWKIHYAEIDVKKLKKVIKKKK